VVSFNAYLKNKFTACLLYSANARKCQKWLRLLHFENQEPLFEKQIQDFEGIILKTLEKWALNADKKFGFIPNQVNYI
jgi:hypothetical protein